MPIPGRIKSVVTVTGASLIASFCSFARNLLIARYVTVEDFGIAATIALTMSFVELASDFGIDRILVQDQSGDEPVFQACAHTIQLLRGVANSVILFALASPVASLFSISQAEWALQTVSLAPFLRGVAHLDYARLQRMNLFRSLALLDTIPALSIVAVTIPLAILLADYRVMVCVILLQAGLQTAVSHAIAVRPYELGFNTNVIRRIVRFGWPLMISGLLAYLSTFGDRAIVNLTCSVRDLGWYTPAVSLMFFPTVIVGRILRTSLLPSISRVQSDEPAYLKHLGFCSVVVLSASTGLCVFCVFAGPAMLLLTFGNQYQDGVRVIRLFALISGFRMLRAGPNLGATALGETKNTLIANLVRSITLPLGVAAATVGWGTTGVVLALLFGEVLGYCSSLIIFIKLCGLTFPISARAFITAFVVVGFSFSLSSAEFTGYHILRELALAVLASAISTVLVFYSHPFSERRA